MKISLLNIFFLVTILHLSCIDPYNPPEIVAEQEYLVIDGVFHPGEINQVHLSYTQNLIDEEAPEQVTNAAVSLEVKGDQSYSYENIGNGNYQLMVVDIPFNTEVRLRVDNNGKEYVSAYVPVLPTPEIDSISFKAEEDGMQFFVNTGDPQNDTWYYRWEYTDTWQFSSVFSSWFEYVNNEVRPRTESIYFCWNSTNSTNIYVTSTNNLSRDIVSMYPLHKVPANSERLRIKYSLLVKQNALTREAYDYYRELRTNTENLGTLFDPLPFQLNGNFTNVDDPAEPVIGFFYASETTEKRIFVNSGDHPYSIPNRFAGSCELDTIAIPDLPEAAKTLLIVDEYIGEFSPEPIGYLMSTPVCVDCRLYGTNVEPDFWQ
ncbi:MAG: DUF4249 domain-containing protein [Cyclobacteriaceae bacterium]